ncbi:MAG: iron-only hydrogenase system regulator [Lachnospiraceae bacterium]|nr:iron-only hydrogenase system regulator [Lachnospiraceae bacterium]
MDTRVAMISIVVENQGDIEKLNQILHEYGSYIIGRMGLPYPKRTISLLSVSVDAPADKISAMTGKIGMLKGITSKALYAKLQEGCSEETD